MSVTKLDLHREQEAHAKTRAKLAALEAEAIELRKAAKASSAHEATAKDLRRRLDAALKRASAPEAGQVSVAVDEAAKTKAALAELRVAFGKMSERVEKANNRLANYGGASV